MMNNMDYPHNIYKEESLQKKQSTNDKKIANFTHI